jgi:hypothetical protein
MIFCMSPIPRSFPSAVRIPGQSGPPLPIKSRWLPDYCIRIYHTCTSKVWNKLSVCLLIFVKRRIISYWCGVVQSDYSLTFIRNLVHPPSWKNGSPKLETVASSKTSVCLCHTLRHHIPKDSRPIVRSPNLRTSSLIWGGGAYTYSSTHY